MRVCPQLGTPANQAEHWHLLEVALQQVGQHLEVCMHATELRAHLCLHAALGVVSKAQLAGPALAVALSSRVRKHRDINYALDYDGDVSGEKLHGCTVDFASLKHYKGPIHQRSLVYVITS